MDLRLPPRIAASKINALKMAMSQWESMLDLYVADLVPPPTSPKKNNPAVPPETDDAMPFDFESFKRQYDIDDGLDFRRDSPTMQPSKSVSPSK